MNKTVLIIHPEISRTRYNFAGVIENECLEAEVWMAVLKQRGYDVYLYDGQIMDHGVPEELKRRNPRFVIVCGRCRQESFMLEYCRDAKAYDPQTVTVIAGAHAQLCRERMEKEETDWILTGYDPRALLYVLGENTGTWQVNGICHKVDGVWSHIPARPYDINLLPQPDRTPFDAHPDRYRYLDLEHAAWVRTSFSCPYHCTFCIRTMLNKGVYSARRIEDAVQEIASVKADNIYLCDDDFLYDDGRIREFIRLIKERGIRKNYICYGRADYIASHPERMKELKEIGFLYILCGLESPDDAFLQDYGKKSGADTNEKCIEVCREAGLRLMAMFIVDPRFRRKDFRALYRYIRTHDLKYNAVSVFTPEMGTDLYHQYRERRITEDPSHYDYLHLTVRPEYMSIWAWQFEYYLLVLRLFLKGKRDGIYDFLDYGMYIRSILKDLFRIRSASHE